MDFEGLWGDLRGFLEGLVGGLRGGRFCWDLRGVALGW